jgi:hypothetical protein
MRKVINGCDGQEDGRAERTKQSRRCVRVPDPALHCFLYLYWRWPRRSMPCPQRLSRLVPALTGLVVAVGLALAAVA